MTLKVLRLYTHTHTHTHTSILTEKTETIYSTRELYSGEKKNSFVCGLSIYKITNNYIDSKQGRNTFISDIKNADYKYRLNLKSWFNPKSSLLFCMPKGVMNTG